MKAEIKQRITASTDFYRDLNERAERAMQARRDDEALAVRKMQLRASLEAQERRAYAIVGVIIATGCAVATLCWFMGWRNA